MKRQSLKSMTPEERAERKRAQARERKRKQRGREWPYQEMVRILKEEEKKVPGVATQARANWPRATMTPELQEFVDELVTRPLAVAALALAMWERDNRQHFPYVDRPKWKAGMKQAQLDALNRNWVRFGLVRLFAVDSLARSTAGDRLKRHRKKESAEAVGLGMDVEAYREHKRKVRSAKERANRTAA